MLDQLQEGDVLVLAGSIPASMPDDIYRNILKRLDGKGILIAVDATGNLLVNVLEYHPFLVKPNNHELGEIFGVEICEDLWVPNPPSTALAARLSISMIWRGPTAQPARQPG